MTLDDAPYKDQTQSIEQRVADLLSRMTLAEKAAQMVGIWNLKNEQLLDEQGDFDPAKAKQHFGHGHGLGQVGRPSDAGGGKNAREMAELTNAIQRFFVEHSRLGIPVVFHEECLHGHAAPQGTSFPQPIGLGATFDPELVQALYRMTAEEARLRGAHQALTPVVDVAREPRWGRVEETYGEDPYLVAQLGTAAVKGFQGDGTFADGKSVIATLKHFAAHGQPESGTNCAPVNVSERVLRETFLFPFKEAIMSGGALSVMASYNEIDGVPSHANRWLLRQVLRQEWGFAGVVVSDYYAISELHDRPETFGHHVAADAKHAAELALTAGVNIELPEPDCYRHVVQLVEEGTIPESLIDELVAPLLEQKFKLGLFDDPYVNPAVAAEVVGCTAHAELALEAARKTITLLKNDGIAPLDAARLSTLAVIGPNADRELLGGYSGVPDNVSTVLQGVRELLGDRVEIVYHRGCSITVGGSWNEDEVVPGNPDEDRASIAEAAVLAAGADAVVLCLGGNEQTSREAWSPTHMGDRTSLDLFGLQNELVDALAATGKPIIAVVFNGRPLAFSHLSERSNALLECWYLGQETGRAVAEALFGVFSPGGKLPITIPRSVGHVPAYYNHRPSARRGYLHESVAPLYAFGFGLSYTSFSIGPPTLDRSEITASESTTVSVEVTNVGPMRGDEVVQLYLRDLVSSVTRPVKELKGFKRITLEPGQTTTVTFDITPQHLALWNLDMELVVEPGEFEVRVGSSSRDEDLQRVVLKVV